MASRHQKRRSASATGRKVGMQELEKSMLIVADLIDKRGYQLNFLLDHLVALYESQKGDLGQTDRIKKLIGL